VSSALTHHDARRNVLVCAATGFMGFAGFTIVMPFIPLYIRELGVRDVGEIAMWSGLTLGATPAITAISAPLWGRVGDRYGSKLLVIRSLCAFVLTKGAMAFVTAPWQLVVLRGLLGVFAGYGALTMAMAAESVPREEMPRAIGMVQMGQRLGPAVGPLLGGLIAPMVGLRRSFLITAAFYIVGIALIAGFYKESRTRHAQTARSSLVSVFRELVGRRGFVIALAVIFTLQTVDRSFGPILPLFVGQLGVAPDRLVFVSGMLFSLIAVSAAVGHKVAAALQARWSPRALVSVVALTTAAALVAMVFVPSLWTLAPALIVASLGIGVAMTAAYSVGGALVPPEAHVTGFGIMTGASLIGMAFSPVLAGVVGSSGLRIVFLVDVALLLMLAAAVLVAMRGRKAPKAPAVPEVPEVQESA
jgi:MFS transporter, DHA1 family, multidrug resistance protein